MTDDELPRPLSAREAETLQFILSVEDDRLIPLREQAATATVVRRCTCGCATIDLSVNQEVAGRFDDRPDFWITSTAVPDPDLPEAYFLYLFVRDGWLSSLEIAYIDEPPPKFPPIEVWDQPRASEAPPRH